MKNKFFDYDQWSKLDYLEPCAVTCHDDPLALLITKFGFANTMDRLSHEASNWTGLFFDVALPGSDFSNVTVSDPARKLSESIKMYYTTAMCTLKLKGLNVSDWREEMLRVIRNTGNCTVQRPDDWKILIKLVEFYFHDCKIDDLTDFANSDVTKRFIKKREADLFTLAVTPRAILQSPVKRSRDVCFLYALDDLDILHKISIYGNTAARDLAQIVLKTNTPIKISFVDFRIRTANGTGVEYIEPQNVTISLAEH